MALFRTNVASASDMDFFDSFNTESGGSTYTFSAPLKVAYVSYLTSNGTQAATYTGNGALTNVLGTSGKLIRIDKIENVSLGDTFKPQTVNVGGNPRTFISIVGVSA